MSSRFRKANLLTIKRRQKRPFPGSLARARRAMIARNTGGWRVRRRGVNQRTSGFVGAAGDAKYIDIAYTTHAIDTTGAISHLSIVAQGNTVNQREGKAFRCTSVYLRGNVTNGITANVNDYSILLVWDKQPNKALAAVTDILDSASAYSMVKRENSARFVILRRFDGVLTGKGDGTNGQGYCRNFDKYVKLPRDCNCLCTVADTTGAIGNRVSGALLLVAVGITAAGGAAAALNVTGRMNFVDI